MRKFVLILLLSLASVAEALYAAPVSRSVATEFACNFLGTVSPELAFTSFEPSVKSGSDVAFYAFNRPSGGWVIIAADNCAAPVLAHSDSGRLSSDNIPSNMCACLKNMCHNIDKISEAEIAPSVTIRSQWATRGSIVRTKADSSPVVLNTALWGQGTPYNQTICLNVKDGNKSVSGLLTGCVATAMAITLRYLQCPASPTDTIPSYTTSTEKYTVPQVNLSSYGNYVWNNMPLQNDNSWTSTQKEAVADLMFHCGAMVGMDYAKDASGAYSSVIPASLSKYMGFSTAAAEYYRENYSNYEWLNMLKAELDAGVPVIYGGSDVVGEGGGHQFVVDGYNSNNEVHVNWGWEGYCNGWYAVCYLGDINVIEGVFNYYDSAILGLRPATTGGSACPHIFMMSYDSDPGLSVSGRIAVNSPFTLSAYVYSENMEYAYEGKAVAALVSADGTIKEFISPEYALSVTKCDGQYYGAGSLSCECEITGEINLGDFIAVYYKNGYGQWARLGGADHTVTQTKGEMYYTVSRISAIPSVAYIYSPSNLESGDVFYCDLVAGGELPESVVWSYDNDTLTDPFVKVDSGKHIVQAVIKYSDGSTQTIRRNITVQ